MTLLQVNNLSIEYRTRIGSIRAVDNLSFRLDRGETLGFVGESGCGKSTLGMAIPGLLPRHAVVTSGEILFKGQNLLDLSADDLRRIRWREIAMVFQAAMNALNPVQPVGDQIAEAIRTHFRDRTKDEIRRQVEALFDHVDLPRERMQEYPHQYSGGMKQRAVIAMALACSPALVIADEPTTALDVIIQAQILETLQTIQEELNLAIIFISHDISVVADLCHTIGVMNAGRLIEYGSREEVLAGPAHPYTRTLTAAHAALIKNENHSQSVQEAPRMEMHSPDPEWIQLTPTHRVRRDMPADAPDRK